MPFKSRFATRRRATSPPSSAAANGEIHEDLRGLDLTSPYDAIMKNRTPFAKNFRLYAEEASDRRVSVSSRKGAGRYLDALGEASSVSNTSTTGAADVLLSKTTWAAMKFVPTTTGPLTRLDLTLKQNGATGPIIVQVHNDSSGVPGTKIADSGILNADVPTSPASAAVRFVEAPTVTSGSTYWIVAYMQADGTGNYSWRSNTTTALALASINGGLSWSSTAYSLGYTAYVANTTPILGMTRYTPESGLNRTMLAIGTTMYLGNDNTNNMTSIATGLSASATDYFFTEGDGKKFWVNSFDDLKYWDGAAVTTITNTNLPKLRLAVMHQNRLFGIDAANPNRLVYSEDPGNGDGTGALWYNAYLATSFIYVPTPKATDPITAIVPFQNNLYIFTRTGKWVLYGSDPGSFNLRKSTGSKGAVSQNAVFADENFIYFIAPDGIYQHNGSSDKQISELVQPEFSNIANLQKCFITKWKRMIRIYYPTSGSAVNNACLLYHPIMDEWLKDTDTYVSRAVPWLDGDDPDRLTLASSTSPAVYFAEMDWNNLGKAIDFEYDCKYDSMGDPSRRKRIVELHPLLEGEGGTYYVNVGVDSDRQNNPNYTPYLLATAGAKIGTHTIGDGTKIGATNQFVPGRIRPSGFAYYWQTRIQQRGINNPVRFIGYTLSYRQKRR